MTLSGYRDTHAAPCAYPPKDSARASHPVVAPSPGHTVGGHWTGFLAALAVTLGVMATAPTSAFAISGETAPKGTLILRLEYQRGVANRYFMNTFGVKTKDVVDDYNGIELTPDLLLGGSDFDTLAGISESDSDDLKLFKRRQLNQKWFLGSTAFKLDAYTDTLKITAAYAITDKWMVGMLMSMAWATYNIDLRLTGSRVGAVALPPPGLENRPGLTGAYPPYIGLTAEDLSAELSKPVDVEGSLGFAYKPLPIGKNQDFGVADIRLGSFHQVHSDNFSEVAVIAFVTLPVGRFSDQDAIYSQKFGDGQWDMGSLMAVDWYPLGREINYGNTLTGLMFHATLGFTVQFPDRRTMRIWTMLRDENGNTTGVLPIVTLDQKARVTRDYGDTHEFWLGGRIQLWTMLDLGFEAYAYYQYSDRYVGANPESTHNPGCGQPLDPNDPAKGFKICHEYRAMEYNSNRSAIELNIYAQFSTIPWAVAGKFIPMLIGVGYNRSIAGMNIDANEQVSVALTLIGPFGLLMEDDPAPPDSLPPASGVEPNPNPGDSDGPPVGGGIRGLRTSPNDGARPLPGGGTDTGNGRIDNRNGAGKDEAGPTAP